MDAMDRLKNWNGTVHYAVAGQPACGPLGTHITNMGATDKPVTCQRCLAKYGAAVPCHPLPPPPINYAEIRAAERAARRAARA